MKEEIKYEDYTDVGTGFLEKMMDKYRCKKCGHLGRMTIITSPSIEEIMALNKIDLSTPLDIICESCERDEKIESILDL